MPSYNPHRVLSRTFRWTADEAFSNYRMSAFFACHFHAIALTGGALGNLWPLYGAVKFRKIELWANTTTAGSPATISVTQCSSTVDPTINLGMGPYFSDTTINPSTPAHISWGFNHPLYKNWMSVSDADFVFDISGPPGTVIEITMDCVLNTQAAVASGLSTTLIPLNPTLGFSPYDLGNAAGTRKLRPALGGLTNPVWL